ncbi:MAG: transcriptional repressor [Proteobacteria bacterium]|nr:transcriptional repressor [Pseudomonadota bacterium]
MQIIPDELDRRMALFEKTLKEAGVKITHQRLEIFREVASSLNHPDAETLFRNVRKKLPTISLDTVYRALWLMVDLGLLTTLGASRDRTRFDANMESHHHFVCSVCGMTHDFYDAGFDRLPVPEKVMEIGKAESVQVRIKGICMRCMRKKEAH